MLENIQHFKQKLEEEHELLERELSEVGVRNPDNPEDWEATPAKMDLQPSDKNEIADGIEAFEERSGELDQLEIQLNEVKHALKRIEEGKYGVCEVCGEPIPEKRLEAFPAARACLEHAL